MRVSVNSMRYAIAAGAALLALCGLAGAQDGEWRWRLSADENVLTLYIAAYEATDDIGSPTLTCRKGSKSVKVSGHMNKALQRAVAHAIVNDVYPMAEPVPDGRDGGGLLEINFSEMDGWTYAFEMPIGAQAFVPLRETGMLSFNFNGALIESGQTVGIEEIAKFQDACRRGAW